MHTYLVLNLLPFFNKDTVFKLNINKNQPCMNINDVVPFF